jgi:predicted transcriptional regulator
MSTMHIHDDLEDRVYALGYKMRRQRIRFVNDAVREKVEREEAEQNE